MCAKRATGSYTLVVTMNEDITPETGALDNAATEADTAAVSTADQGAPGEASSAGGGAPGLIDRPRLPRTPLVPSWIPIGLAVLVGLVLVVAGIAAYVGTSSKVTVPKVTGLELGVARARLSQVGLGVNVVEHRFSDRDPDTILSQDPKTGSTLRRGDSVDVIVSAGSEEFAMPDVVGDGLLLARGVLESKGLEVRIEAQPSEQPSDTVLGTNPAPGTMMSTGDVVRLTVASPGPGSSTFLPLDMTGVVIKLDPAPVPAGEADVTLDVTRRLRSLVEASGGTVIATRSLNDTGTATSIATRAQRASEGSSTAAIGLSVVSKGPGGIIAFSPSTGGAVIVQPSAALASRIATSLAASGLAAKTSKSATDAVLSATGAPWTQLQLGSLAAREDVASFRDPTWADTVARAVYRALADLYGRKSTTP